MNFFGVVRSALEKYRRAALKRGCTCDGCGREVFDYPAERLCGECLSSFVRNDGHTCIKCGRKTAAEGVCLDCKQTLPLFSRGLSPFVYCGTAARLLNRLKNGERYLSGFFGECMAEALKAALPKGTDSALLVPVPLTAEREKRRGYNQAEELAERIAEILGAETGRDVLVKARETPSQKRLTGRERAKNVSGAYRVKDGAAGKGRTVILVDDIMTTGATGSECARVLSAAGAKEVVFLTAASAAERV